VATFVSDDAHYREDWNWRAGVGLIAANRVFERKDHAPQHDRARVARPFCAGRSCKASSDGLRVTIHAEYIPVPNLRMALRVQDGGVLADGERVVRNTPGAIQPPFEVMAEAVARHIGPDVGRFVRVVFSMDDPDEVGQLLGEVGFRDVDVKETAAVLQLPPAADFLWQYVNVTPMGGFVHPAPEEAKAALEQDVVDGWEAFTREDGTVRVEQPMVMATGRA
jgi:hypothetical protein